MSSIQAEDALQSMVDAGDLAGAVTLIWREGAIAEVTCAGWRDPDARLPVERDTLFRVASLTKPITAAATLSLVEEGRFELSDPITRWAPELARMQVLRAPGGALTDTVPARRPLTFHDLLTHRAGLSYSDFLQGPIAAAYRDALGGHIDNARSPDEWIARLAELPLLHQPGEVFEYGHAADLLGFILARVEDAPLGEVLRRRVFEPLGMVDTGFAVPEAKRPRRAACCGFDADGQVRTRATVPGAHALPERPEGMTFVSGGQGLWSTVDDYLSFARIFVEGGAGLLRPETVARMTTNQLTAPQRAASMMLGRPLFATGHGFGLGVAVVTEPESADPLLCGGNRGAVGWPGAYGSWWRADPVERSVRIFMTHNMVEAEQLAQGVGLGVWTAILEFQEQALRSP
ncbi:MAG: beta-lactamase family protein [Alphaproteobacteria bacterium]|nr:beta-lactamase family protein [Alphaproteobacteria bacterium]